MQALVAFKTCGSVEWVAGLKSTVWINAVGFYPCQLGMSNKVDLCDPDFTLPSRLNVKF